MSPLATFIIGFFSSLAAAVAFVFIAAKMGVIRVSWRSFAHNISLRRRMAVAGFVNFYASREDFAKYRGAPRLIDYLSLARSSVRVAGYWMAHGTEMEGIAESIAEIVKPPKRLQLTVGIIDPTSPYINSLANYLDMQPHELASRLKSSLYKLHKARETLGADEKARYRLKVYDTIPVASVIILDAERDDGRVQIDLKAYKASRQNSFAIELSGAGHPLYELCRDAWTKLLDDAQDFDPARHLRDYIP